jgi:diacylglycerol kinase family enzyme
MASLGSDANVVHRLAHNRTGRINHLSYIPHAIAELLSPALPRYTITANGRTLVDDKRGWAVIANARQYALRVDPAPHADPADGMLDLVFCPAYTTLSLIGWFARARLRTHLRSPQVVRARASRFTVTAERPAHYQLDGEAPLDSAGDPHLGPVTTPIQIGVRPAALPVLAPPITVTAPAPERPRPSPAAPASASDPATA